jgi:hypothetical protein
MHPDAGYEVLYPQAPPTALRAVFDKRGALVGVYAGEAHTPDALRALRDRIDREFVASAGDGVNRQVCFTTAPVRGWWRYRDRFQILPVPEHAPKADFAFFDLPFLIEFRYPRAVDFVLGAHSRVEGGSRSDTRTAEGGVSVLRALGTTACARMSMCRTSLA